jgi:hypothetical protein
VLSEIWIAVSKTRKMAKSLEQRGKFLVSLCMGIRKLSMFEVFSRVF